MPPKKAASAAPAPAPAPSSPTVAQPTGTGGDTSILSTTSATAEPKSPTTSKSRKSQSDDIGIDDLLLPRSLTSRIARGVLPPNTSLQKDAILALTKSATVFISALASNANELTARKTIQAGDVMKALKEMELDTVMRLGQVGSDGGVGGRMERELEVYEEGVKGKRKGYREKVRARESGVSGVGETDGVPGLGLDRGEDGEPQAKRVRRGSQADEEDEDDEEDLLNKQLNGDATNGHGGEEGEEMRDVVGEVEEKDLDNDETEDDPDAHEDEGEEDDEPEDEEEEEEDEDPEQGNGSGDEDRVDVEESPHKTNRYALAPDGRAEVGSEDESD